MTSQSDASYSDDVFGSIEDEHCVMMTPISKTREFTGSQDLFSPDESTDAEDYLNVCFIKINYI